MNIKLPQKLVLQRPTLVFTRINLTKFCFKHLRVQTIKKKRLNVDHKLFLILLPVLDKLSLNKVENEANDDFIHSICKFCVCK